MTSLFRDGCASALQALLKRVDYLYMMNLCRSSTAPLKLHS
ncbi:hypothetical protein [Chelatococcus daeguensis]|nr:hypothetical protein [Chelatococcus daeguensis]